MNDFVIIRFKPDWDRNEFKRLSETIELDTGAFRAGISDWILRGASERPASPSDSTPQALAEMNRDNLIVYDFVDALEVEGKQNI